MSTVEIELDDDLLALIDERAAASGRPRSEVVSDALRQQFGRSPLREILAEVRERSGLSEQQATDLAVSELAAARAQRTAGESA